MHRERRRTTPQALENAALRVDQGGAGAASQTLDDASGIAGAPAPDTRASLVDAGHKHYSDRLLGGAKVVLFSHPNNPTGAVYEPSTLKVVAALVEAHDGVDVDLETAQACAAHAAVADAASVVFIDRFGERGVHAWTAIDVVSLPRQSKVEIDAAVEIIG